MPRKQPKAPICPHCRKPAELVNGDVMYPHRKDLSYLNFWRCVPCGAYVGCHKGTTKALGVPANADLRTARIKLHNLRLDPIWKSAIETGGYAPEDTRAKKIILNAARRRTYEWLAAQLGIPFSQCHIGMFDIETCRRAWTALFQKTYPEIRDWAKARKTWKLGVEYPTVDDLLDGIQADCAGCRAREPLVDRNHEHFGRCKAFALREELIVRVGNADALSLQKELL